MTQADKDRFDALCQLRDHAWEEFKNKSEAEWRLSLALWAALLGSAAAVLSADALDTGIIRGLLVSLGIAVISLSALHLSFLFWVQTKLAGARDFIFEAQSEMRRLAGLPEKPPESKREPAWDQRSLFVQFWLTVLAALVLILVLVSRAG